MMHNTVILYTLLFLAIGVVISFRVVQTKRIQAKKELILSSKKKDDFLAGMLVATTYEETKKQLHEALGKNLLVLPDSVKDPEQLVKRVSEINMLVVELNKILTSQDKLVPNVLEKETLLFFRKMEKEVSQIQRQLKKASDLEENQKMFSDFSDSHTLKLKKVKINLPLPV